MSVLAMAARMIATRGEAMILSRDGEAAIPLKGKRVAGTHEEFGRNAVSQQLFLVKIGTAELLASAWASKVPARGDTLTVASRARTVLDVRPLKYGEAIALYELDVAGAG